jgi:group I intron endonuclease
VIQQLIGARGFMGIYAIVRVETGESYIGSSSNIGNRLNCHRSYLRRGVHKTPRLQAAWTEHGESAFSYVLIERVDDLSVLGKREQYWLDESECWIPGIGYNRSPACTGAGWQYKPESVARLSAALTGKKKSPEHCAAMSARVYTPEQQAGYRERMAAVGRAGKGVPKKAAHRRKIGAAQKGSQNHRSKLTEADVIEIHWHLAIGEKSKAEIGRLYGIAGATVRGIQIGKSWGHLKPKQ